VTAIPNTSTGFSGNRAADVVGITYRQLDYWARTDLIRPSLADAKGSGSRRRYSYRNLLELKLIKTLLDNGIKLASIRAAFSYLRDQLGEDDVASAKLVIAGNSAVLVRENEELIDVVNRYQGQGVLNLLSLDGVKEQVDAAIVELFPGEGAPEGEAHAGEAGDGAADTPTPTGAGRALGRTGSAPG
jgi:DNA-binding transcriptional MerR regulator